MDAQDATAYNVQFRDGRPILIDSLSFAPLEDGAPWIAYRQFCEHFLAPLALMARRDVRLAASCARIPTGSRSTSLRRSCRGAHGSTSACCPTSTSTPGPSAAMPTMTRPRRRPKGQDRPGAAGRAGREPAVNRRRAALEPGRHGVVGLRGPHELRRPATAAKVRLVGEWSARRARGVVGPRRQHRSLQPGRRGRGRRVLAFDIDPAAAERNYRQIRSRGRATSCRS